MIKQTRVHICKFTEVVIALEYISSGLISIFNTCINKHAQDEFSLS